MSFNCSGGSDTARLVFSPFPTLAVQFNSKFCDADTVYIFSSFHQRERPPALAVGLFIVKCIEVSVLKRSHCDFPVL